MNGKRPDFNLRDATVPTPSPFDDCRSSETESASEAVASCARFLESGDPIFVIYCISAADVAYDHVLVDHEFRRWLLDVAIPGTLEGRCLTEAEQNGLRP